MSAHPSHPKPKINSTAVIGNYLPRKCGIATFTTDLVQSLSKQNGHCQFKAIAINDKPHGYDYPDEVCFEINQHSLRDYRTAAEFININQIDVVSLQHEFGIFGGPGGHHILKLLQELRMPVITTLHTIQAQPPKKQAIIMEQLIELSDKLVVMSQTAVNILQALYDIPKGKIVYIPHGIPDMPFVDPNYYKEKFDLMGHKVLLTFGLLSRNKGIEYVIRGLPNVVQQFPDLTYIVLGATHPNVLESEGEEYRTSLEQLVKELDLEDHVRFVNQFVPFEELCEYLAATDLYVTPYINEDQITSGTLAYALGTGKAVISTPYWYAKEMLAGGNGRLVPFKDAEAITDAIIALFEDNAERHQIRKRAYDSNRKTTWNEVGRQYLEVFHQAKQEYHHRPRPHTLARSPLKLMREVELPPVKLDHLFAITDDTGILQHAYYSIAKRNHGYCTDDNARALIVALLAQNVQQLSRSESSKLYSLSSRYLSFLTHAYHSESGRFRNFMSYSREWKEDFGSMDSHGRALWALGMTTLLTEESPHLPLAAKLFSQGLDAAESFDSPRSIAFTLIGIDAYLKTFPGDSKARRTGIQLMENLYNRFATNATDDWPWLENIVTYANAKLPHALILMGQTMHRDDIVQMGLRSLAWLVEIQIENSHLSLIGNQGWYSRDGHRARFAQQPLDANGLIEACISAYKITDNKCWLNRAMICFNWFLGYNDLRLPLYDERTGGCRDGLESDKVNQNQGAESTLAWLLSITAMHRVLTKEKEPEEITPAKFYHETMR